MENFKHVVLRAFREGRFGIEIMEAQSPVLDFLGTLSLSLLLDFPCGARQIPTDCPRVMYMYRINTRHGGIFASKLRQCPQS